MVRIFSIQRAVRRDNVGRLSVQLTQDSGLTRIGSLTPVIAYREVPAEAQTFISYIVPRESEFRFDTLDFGENDLHKNPG